jgi:hypothetical protein
MYDPSHTLVHGMFIAILSLDKVNVDCFLENHSFIFYVPKQFVNLVHAYLSNHISNGVMFSVVESV